MNTEESTGRSPRLDVRLRRRFFYRLSIGTLVFCVVPVAIVVLVSSFFFANRIVDEFRAGKRENLQAVMVNNARLMQEFEVYIKYATDRDLMYFVDHSFHDDIVRFQHLLNRLSAQVAASDHIDSLHFYSGAFGYMTTISSDGYRFARFDGETDGAEVPVPGPDIGWSRALGEERYFRPFYRADYQGTSEALSYIVPIFEKEQSGRTALIANIELESVVRRARSMSRDDGGNTYMIVDNAVIPLLTRFALPVEAVPRLEDAGTTLGMSPGRLIVTSAHDTENDLRFVSVVSRSRLTRNLRSIFSTYYLVIVLFTALLVAVAWGYTKRLYRPIEQVLDVVSASDRAWPSSPGRTALQHIAGEYRRVADQNEHLRERLASDREVVREHVVDELLRGRVTADIEDTLPELGVDSRELSYVVLIVHAERDVEVSVRQPSRQATQNVLGEIVDDELEAAGVRGLVCALANGEVAVIVVRETPQAGSIQSFMQGVADHGSSALDTDVHVGSSEEVMGLQSIVLGYRQAVEALRRGILERSVRVHTYDDMKREERKRVESNRVVNRFTEVLARTDDESAVSNFVSDLVRDAQEQCNHHADLQAHCIESVISIMDYAEGRSVGDAKRELARFCERLTACRTGGEITTVIRDVLSDIARKCRAVSYPHGAVDANVTRTLCYVEEHHQENIGLDTVADAVGLNPSYLSRIFKRVTKIPFHEHLARVRVGKARTLLVESDVPIYEIARAVGYGSPLTFKRNFRKIEGCTPREYRDSRASVAT